MAQKKRKINELKKLKENYDIIIWIVKNKKDDLDLEKEDKNIEIENKILSIYNNFYSNLNKVDDFFKLNKKILEKEEESKKNNIDKLIKKNKIKENENEIILWLTKEQFKDFHKNNRDKKIIWQWEVVLPKSMLIYFHSLFEHFLSKILILIYNNSEEQLQESDIKFSFLELKNFNSIEDAKKYIISNKISNILYSPINKQIDILLNLLWIYKDYKECFPINSLIEISLRRNLFTHEDWIVNDIYINKCNEFWIENKFKKWKKIVFEENYFTNIYNTYYEFVIKIIFFSWIKLSNNEKKYEEAVWVFVNNRAFKMIQQWDLSLWLKIIEFVLTPKIIKKIDEATYLMATLNKALIYKIKKEKNKVSSILKGIDWSAKSDLYKFAHYILNEDRKQAWELMPKVVKKKRDKDYLSEYDLKTWPLFFEFKEQEIFKKNYKRIFKKDFILDF